MKKLLLFLSLFYVSNIAFAQHSLKTPGLMLGFDSTLVVMEYSNFNNLSTDETWIKYSMPGRIIYYCEESNDKNKTNVAHVYDFDENGINVKYTTVTTQDKIKFAVDYFNNLSRNRKNVYKFEGVIAKNTAVWVSNEEVSENEDCNCGNVKVTVMSNLKMDNDVAVNCGVKAGKSGELLAIVYTPNK